MPNYCEICKRIGHKQGACGVPKGQDAKAADNVAREASQAGQEVPTTEEIGPLQGQSRGQTHCSRDRRHFHERQLRMGREIEDSQIKGAEQALAIVEEPTPIATVHTEMAQAQITPRQGRGQASVGRRPDRHHA